MNCRTGFLTNGNGFRPHASLRAPVLHKSLTIRSASARSLLDKTPLNLTAETLFLFSNKPSTVTDLFSAYEEFLGVLSDKSKRKQLENSKPDQLDTDRVYAEARQICHRFAEAFQSIFLNSDNPIGKLTIEVCGVLMRFIGYSTGAIALGDFSRSLTLFEGQSFQAVELSALRISEVEPMAGSAFACTVMTSLCRDLQRPRFRRV